MRRAAEWPPFFFMATWNERYVAGEGLNKTPEDVVLRAAASMSPGKALDLACGLGRHAIYLAQSGWQVVAVDSSDAAIASLPLLSALTSVKANLEAGEFTIQPDTYDLIIDSLFLWRPLFPSILRGIRDGGCFVGLFPSSGVRPEYLIPPAQLLAIFSGWEILHFHEQPRIELVARKPSPA